MPRQSLRSFIVGHALPCSQADDINNNNSGHFDWNYTEQSKCKLPFGGPTWCMTENMANATYRGFNYPHHTASCVHRT